MNTNCIKKKSNTNKEIIGILYINEQLESSSFAPHDQIQTPFLQTRKTQKFMNITHTHIFCGTPSTIAFSWCITTTPLWFMAGKYCTHSETWGITFGGLTM